MVAINIDVIEESLARTLRNFNENTKYKAKAEQIFYTDALNNPGQLTAIFGSAAEIKYLLNGLQGLADTAKQVSDVKGDACLPEVKEFIANVKTLSYAQYNNLLEFSARTVLKENIDNLHKPNPFG